MAYEKQSELRDLLAQLYPREDEARRVASDAGLPVGRIVFSSSAQTRWHNVLEEAAKTRWGVQAVRQVAAHEYPEYFSGAGPAGAEPLVARSSADA
jgi:hypothetical protein